MRCALRCIVVVAHPDDETLGAGGLLQHLAGATIVHVTDGAPRDRRLLPFPPGFEISRERYAALRRHEVTRALGLAGIPPERLHALGAVDQEAILEVPSLAQRLVALFDELRPDTLITHPYEGGHPDHDATALAIHCALALQRHSRPLLVEAASYNAPSGRLVTGEFLRAPGTAPLTLALAPEEQARKQEMLACFTTQAGVLSLFDSSVERFRVAPRYDFTRAPHAGPLHYERLGWAMTGRHWRRLAREALDELGLRGRK
ncbi:MAG: PIG-L family deacetylase [Myxococcaceae bacterium]|nr:PIG-L family deacetylase [Myxococcaceae bacterium]